MEQLHFKFQMEVIYLRGTNLWLRNCIWHIILAYTFWNTLFQSQSFFESVTYNMQNDAFYSTKRH